MMPHIVPHHEPAIPATSDQEEDRTAANKKTMRKRRKKMFVQIREQVEFYFSDSNLRNDQYMKQLMMREAAGKELVGDEAVPLSEIVRFNKISCLTTKEEDVRRALRSSSVLILAPGGSSVRRKQAVDFNRNVDPLTIYVENLPDHVSHEWVKHIFSAYGTVQYISIPKFPDKRTKGFAFIEFSSETAVREACRAFRAQVPPANESEQTETQDSDEKRNSEPIEEPIAKKLKTHVLYEAAQDGCTDGDLTACKLDVAAKSEVTTLNLRVMSKQEWSEWKRKYKQLQTENMKKVKKVIRLEPETESAIPSAIASKLANLINATPLPDKATEHVAKDEEPISVIKLSIRLKGSEIFEEAVYKKRFRQLADPIQLAYVDVDKSQTQFLDDHTVVHTCYLRCSSSSDAQSLCELQAFRSLGTACVLSGDEEERYRERMQVSRQLANQNKNHKGYKKWAQRAGKVLAFDLKS